MEQTKDKLPTYKFSSFTEQMVKDAFGLKQTLEPEGYLTDWIQKAKSFDVSTEETKVLTRLNKKLKLFVRGWNEQELRGKFIDPVLELVDFDMYSLEIASFAEREMKVTYNNSIIQGKVEWMVAKGVYAPKQPFFLSINARRKRTAPMIHLVSF